MLFKCISVVHYISDQCSYFQYIIVKHKLKPGTDCNFFCQCAPLATHQDGSVSYSWKAQKCANGTRWSVITNKCEHADTVNNCRKFYCLSLRPSASMSVCISVCQSFRPYICVLSVGPSSVPSFVRLSSIRLKVQSVCLSVCGLLLRPSRCRPTVYLVCTFVCRPSPACHLHARLLSVSVSVVRLFVGVPSLNRPAVILKWEIIKTCL